MRPPPLITAVTLHPPVNLVLLALVGQRLLRTALLNPLSEHLPDRIVLGRVAVLLQFGVELAA